MIHNLIGKIIWKRNLFRSSNRNYKVPQKVYINLLSNTQIITSFQTLKWKISLRIKRTKSWNKRWKIIKQGFSKNAYVLLWLCRSMRLVYLANHNRNKAKISSLIRTLTKKTLVLVRNKNLKKTKENTHTTINSISIPIMTVKTKQLSLKNK